jgi:hypothetical protein
VFWNWWLVVKILTHIQWVIVLWSDIAFVIDKLFGLSVMMRDMRTEWVLLNRLLLWVYIVVNTYFGIDITCSFILFKDISCLIQTLNSSLIQRFLITSLRHGIDRCSRLVIRSVNRRISAEPQLIDRISDNIFVIEHIGRSVITTLRCVSAC